MREQERAGGSRREQEEEGVAGGNRRRQEDAEGSRKESFTHPELIGVNRSEQDGVQGAGMDRLSRENSESIFVPAQK